ncbi:single-stranded-DNA-specific exonuclease RecJ [Ferrimonas sp. SCSIO 43195]|uniref:single-stranded-DNA-specific exonuclease RecJ n=1 Tax=Ferrimonas sp. SCSIO 43195 TaxID=2822844 RepID=UPI002075E301|nr:single-stranded-DNA-specific exonuclease RecJ [Ferrimonas sp. SCSIO 43195]USD38081.1 single-stranded-DNA-specific exonuclease RecJ [Ferrimonas sp. SCSIO 43195]
MTKIVRRPTVDDSHLPAHLPDLLRQLYARRGVSGGHELERELKGLLNPATLKGTEAAATLLAEALQRQQAILVVGDFDADGATSSALTVMAMRMMGAQKIDYLVPNRFDYGYGLSPELVDLAAGMQAEVLVTVDNGISAHEGVDAAKAAGMTVIVTDHHLPGERLPDADAIVNPSQPGCEFASKAMAGVGVAFYLMLALRGQLRQRGWFEQQQIAVPNMATLLDVVALGTVADVVPLDANNRLLVQQGIQRIRAGRCRPGISALLEVSGRSAERLVASDLGFSVGPRLNAAGRLDDMSLGIECLLADNLVTARQLASRLDSLNAERREIEAEMQQEAVQALESLQLRDDDLPWGVALYQADWHQGVIGILASRIKERYHRPVIAFADAGKGELKGSARSIPGLHMRDLLERIDTLNPGMILKFGGHAMAAGLSLKAQSYPAFAKAYDQAVHELLDESQLTGELLSDGELAAASLSLETARVLREAGPWGQAFPEPLFDGQFRLLDQRLVGHKHLKMVVETACGSLQLDAIAFNVDLKQWPNAAVQWVELAYRLDVNHWRGNDSVQLMVEFIDPR